MRVTYYALKSLMVGDQSRQAGDLVPEAADWPYLSHYVQDGTLAPVLVVTLPQEVQDMLSEWEHRDDEEPAVEAEQESGGAADEADDTTKEAAPVDVSAEGTSDTSEDSEVPTTEPAKTKGRK